MQHFLLTRFNLALWHEDKRGNAIDRDLWLEERMRIFETYCMPSVAAQTCQDFRWILLVDADTPERFRPRIRAYRDRCPQIRLVAVKQQNAFRFAAVFRRVVADELVKHGDENGGLCLTTYLDNDDSIACRFVETVQRECAAFALQPGEKRALSFDYGLQIFTDMQHLTTRILYPNNHFLTLAEVLPPLGHDAAGGTEGKALEAVVNGVRTCYGYGSHFLLERRGLVEVRHIHDAAHPMWIEVIHAGNVDNDVKMTLDTHFVGDRALLRRDFALAVDAGMAQRGAFVRRALAQMWRRALQALQKIGKN